ncbi:hypothetical protein VTI74DRAFT_10547 [Chaetomium olivicolor]
MPQESVPTATAEPDVGLIFDLSPLALLVLSLAWRITRALSRFLREWRVAADDYVGQELLRFVATQMRPSRPEQLAQLTATIDDAVAARPERATKASSTRYAVWRARVIPIFNSDELLSIVLEWHEAPPSHLEDELVKPDLSTDEAFYILVQAVEDYAIFLLNTEGHARSDGRKLVESRLIAAYEESEKLKSDFLADKSHEIRAPMLSILSVCILLLDTPLVARQRDPVSIMDESGQVLLQVAGAIRGAAGSGKAVPRDREPPLGIWSQMAYR